MFDIREKMRVSLEDISECKGNVGHDRKRPVVGWEDGCGKQIVEEKVRAGGLKIRGCGRCFGYCLCCMAFEVPWIDGLMVEVSVRNGERTFIEVVAFAYARGTADSDFVDQYGACVGDKVDVGCYRAGYKNPSY